MTPSMNERQTFEWSRRVALEKWVHNSSADINFVAVRERTKEGRKEGRSKRDRVKNRPVRSSFVSLDRIDGHFSAVRERHDSFCHKA